MYSLDVRDDGNFFVGRHFFVKFAVELRFALLLEQKRNLLNPLQLTGRLVLERVNLFSLHFQEMSGMSQYNCLFDS